MYEERAEEEMEIAQNVPILAKADKIVKKAMDKYWNWKANRSGEWHSGGQKVGTAGAGQTTFDWTK